MKSTSPKKMTLREQYDKIRKSIKKNNGKSTKSKYGGNSSYTYTGQDSNGLGGQFYLNH